MMTQWHEFLAGRGATLAEGRVTDFGDAGAERQALTDGNVLADLSHLGLLQLEGDDAVTFLQGQVTNDVRQLDGSHSHYSGYCTPKGRMLAMLLAITKAKAPESLRLPPNFTSQQIASVGAITPIAGPLFHEYLLAFEVTSILLLSAIIGAVALARRRDTVDAR